MTKRSRIDPNAAFEMYTESPDFNTYWASLKALRYVAWLGVDDDLEDVLESAVSGLRYCFEIRDGIVVATSIT
jgi:hypothetical protein